MCWYCRTILSDSNSQPLRAPGLAPLKLDFEQRVGGPLRAIVTGEIDFSSASAMQARIVSACERNHSHSLILDLAGVEFMDSSGLRALLHLQRELDEEGGGLALAMPTAEVRNILTLTGLERHLPIAETLEQAEALLATERPQASEEQAS
jgi:anti-anti-sigma factor